MSIRSSRSPRSYRRTVAGKVHDDPPKSRLELVLTLGFGVAVTGIFGLTTEVIKERYDIRVQRCTLAAQVVTDEAVSNLAAPAIQRHVVAEAYGRLDSCLKE